MHDQGKAERHGALAPKEQNQYRIQYQNQDRGIYLVNAHDVLGAPSDVSHVVALDNRRNCIDI
jgi:hypothetical protein